MSDTIIPAILVFGVLLVVALVGLVRSSAAAERITSTPDEPTVRPGERRL